MNISYHLYCYISLCCAIGYLSYKYFSLKIAAAYHTNNSEDKFKELEITNQELSAQNIALIKQVEQLNYKNEALNQIINNTEAIKLEAQQAAKSALFDLGSELSKQLIEIHKRENQESREISEKNIATKSEKFNSEFERIVSMIGGLGKEIEQSKSTVDLIKQSLLSPTGAGKLAEITLENILKSSGLRNNLDYVMQYNLVSQDNTKLRPDALIFLPSGHLMVIDAKASKFLTDYNEQSGMLAKTMNFHLKSLCSKEYAEHALSYLQSKGGEFNNQITLMFLPTEQAIEKIMAADHTFMHRAWSFNIFPVGPCGIMNMLSLAKFQISDNRRLENHKIIIEEIRKLLLSIGGLAEHSQKLSNNIQSLVSNYDKFAGSFNRNFLSKAKNIERLGINLGNKDVGNNLERFQIVTNKTEIIEHELEKDTKVLEEV